jgi:hypothetical protein
MVWVLKAWRKPEQIGIRESGSVGVRTTGAWRRPRSNLIALGGLAFGAAKLVALPGAGNWSRGQVRRARSDGRCPFSLSLRTAWCFRESGVDYRQRERAGHGGSDVVRRL